MSINHDLSKSSEHFSNQVHGISFNYKRNENKKRNHSEFYQNDEQSYDLEFEEIDNERGFERDDEGLEYFDYQDFILMAFDDEWEEIIAEATKVAVSE